MNENNPDRQPPPAGERQAFKVRIGPRDGVTVVAPRGPLSDAGAVFFKDPSPPRPPAKPSGDKPSPS
jgi:hypothetical protein